MPCVLINISSVVLSRVCSSPNQTPQALVAAVAVARLRTLRQDVLADFFELICRDSRVGRCSSAVALLMLTSPTVMEQLPQPVTLLDPVDIVEAMEDLGFPADVVETVARGVASMQHVSSATPTNRSAITGSATSCSSA